MAMRAGWALAGALALGAAAPAGAQQQDPGQQYINVSAFLGADTKCHLFTPIVRAGLEAGRAEILLPYPYDQTVPVRNAATQAMNQAAAGPCETIDAQATTAMRQAGENAAKVWLLRADAWLKEEAKNPWSKGLASIGGYADRIDAAAKALGVDAQARADAVGPIARMVAVECYGRRTVRADKPRACPEIPEADKAGGPFAEGMLSTIESFGLSYIGAQDKAKAAEQAAAEAAKPVEIGPITQYWKWIPAAQFGTAGLTSTKCARGDIVIRVLPGNQPDTFPLIRLGSRDDLGKVQVGQDGQELILVYPDPTASRNGVGGLGKFKRCDP